MSRRRGRGQRLLHRHRLHPVAVAANAAPGTVAASTRRHLRRQLLLAPKQPRAHAGEKAARVPNEEVEERREREGGEKPTDRRC